MSQSTVYAWLHACVLHQGARLGYRTPPGRPAKLTKTQQPRLHTRGAVPLFGDAASFAQWGSLGSTWAPRGQQPLVPTTGKRQGDPVCGPLDYFRGRLFAHGHTGRRTAARSCACLAAVRAATDQPLGLSQDGARYQTAQRTRACIAAHAERLTGYQVPTYAPADHPSEHRWRPLKRRNTPHRSCPTCADLTTAVERARASFPAHPAAVQQLMGTYLDQMAALAALEEAPSGLAQAA